MRKFLLNVALFATIVLLLLAVGEIIARRTYSPYKYKADWMDVNASKVSTLILGSSHTYYGINSRELGDSVFNLANVSQTPEQDLMLFKHYADSLYNLKRVIMPVSYFTFIDPPLEEGDEWFRIKDYKIHMGLTDHSDFSKYNFEISDIEGYAAKIKSHWVHTQSNACDSLGDGLGFGLDDRSPNWDDAESVKARLEKTTAAPEPSVAVQTEGYLKELLQELGKRDVECIFVTTPVWHSYYANLDQRQLEDMYRRINLLSKQYGVRYLDFIDNEEFTDEDFHDVDHLSDRGAIKFSRMLKDELSLTKH